MSTLFNRLCSSTCLFNAWKFVKSKNAAGGIDGFTVLSFEENLEKNLKQILEELKSGKWNPEPYLRIEIPKNNEEKRILGLLSIKDKIVQQAIRSLIEPRFESLFFSNSYGYRPERGATRAIRRTIHEMRLLKNPWIVKLDIDNYFDTVKHPILFERLKPIVKDTEILRLIELSVKTGMVTQKLKWKEITEGVPQGAVLSPLLANFYLHSFDQFVLSKTKAYVRYADDFVIMCESEEQIREIIAKATEFLQKRLLLKLNEPLICEAKNGVPFLGVILSPEKISISEEKRRKLSQRIQSLEFQKGYFTRKSLEELDGIKYYYAQLLPQKEVEQLDEELIRKVSSLIDLNFRQIPNAKQLQNSLKCLSFFSPEYEMAKAGHIKNWIDRYAKNKRDSREQKKEKTEDDRNKTLISRKKREYQSREAENSELVISSFGSFIGKNNKGISVKINGKSKKMPPSKKFISHPE